MMVLRAVLLVLLLSVALACSLSGCGGNGDDDVDGGLIVEPSRDVLAAVLVPSNITDPMEYTFFVHVSFTWSDTNPDSAALVQFDPGDGSGWVDVTQQFRDYWFNSFAPPYSQLYRYVYSAPGTYFYQARVTYTDGEVRSFTSGAEYAAVVPRVQ